MWPRSVQPGMRAGKKQHHETVRSSSTHRPGEPAGQEHSEASHVTVRMAKRLGPDRSTWLSPGWGVAYHSAVSAQVCRPGCGVLRGLQPIGCTGATEIHPPRQPAQPFTEVYNHDGLTMGTRTFWHDVQISCTIPLGVQAGWASVMVATDGLCVASRPNAANGVFYGYRAAALGRLPRHRFVVRTGFSAGRNDRRAYSRRWTTIL